MSRSYREPLRERLARWIAWRLPRSVAYWVTVLDAMQRWVRVTPSGITERGRFGPLEADHPVVGRVCPMCSEPLAVGDVPALTFVRPADDEQRKRAKTGRTYIAAAEPAHERCVY